ncbi:MAG TPA: hypothetical protein VGL03_09795 [Thermoanaerobaculia bacterium]
MRTGKSVLLLSLVITALVSTARAQSWGVGGAAGLVNDIDERFALDGFKRSEVNGWIEYRMDQLSILRLTYGSMRTRARNAGAVLPSVTIPDYKERVNYATVGVSYLLWEGFYTSGLFAGIGGYHVKPDSLPPELAAFRDRDETVFGFHAGVDGEFRLVKHLGLVGRLTYHNISAHPHRQFLNADAGLVGRF